VTTRIVQGAECFLGLEFRSGFAGRGGKELLVRGGSHLKLAEDGRIAWHRDYWDAAEELYEKLPVLGQPDALAEAPRGVLGRRRLGEAGPLRQLLVQLGEVGIRRAPVDVGKRKSR
jgi:hypothetical protein